MHCSTGARIYPHIRSTELGRIGWDSPDVRGDWGGRDCRADERRGRVRTGEALVGWIV